MPAKTNKECPVPAGILIVIGGKENKGNSETDGRKSPNGFAPLVILKKFVELIEKDDPAIEIITTASEEGNASFEEYKAVLNQIGIKKIGHIHHAARKDVLNEDLSEGIKNSDGFFFSGGDQLLLTSFYGGTPFLYDLKKRYIHEKIIIGGTSAGAMALSTPMIYAGNKEIQQLGGEIKITTGMEFLKDVCIDTHFVNRGRFVRLAQVINTNPACIGIGIEEDTAIIIRNGLEAEVIGSGIIIIVKGFNIIESSIREFTNKKPVSIRNLTVDILASGDNFVIPQSNPPHI